MSENKKNDARTPTPEQAAELEQEAEGLPELTDKQMNFVLGILAGKTASDAYREAYDCKNMSNQCIWVKASELRSHDKVTVWLEASKALSLVDVKCTRDAHLRELERIKHLAIARNNLVVAGNMEHLRGKVEGHYVERYENVTPEDPIKILRELEKVNPEYALALAKEHKLDWKPKETMH